MRRSAALPFAALLLAGACATSTDAPAAAAAVVDTAAVSAAADSLRSRYSALQVAGDASGVAALHADDAGVDVFGQPRLRGRAAIETAMNADYAARKFTVTEISPLGLEARSNSDGSELGTYHNMFTAGGKNNHEWGRYLVAFSKGTDGQWRIVYLMAFSDSTKVDK